LAWTKSSNEGLVRAKESTNLQKLFAAAMENQQTLLFSKNEGKKGKMKHKTHAAKNKQNDTEDSRGFILLLPLEFPSM
jgi:hypothetical protein